MYFQVLSKANRNRIIEITAILFKILVFFMRLFNIIAILIKKFCLFSIKNFIILGIDLW